MENSRCADWRDYLCFFRSKKLIVMYVCIKFGGTMENKEPKLNFCHLLKFIGNIIMFV